MDNLDPRLFFQIFSALIRSDSSDVEMERSRRTMRWLGENLLNVWRVCQQHEKNLLSVIWDHFLHHGCAPSLTVAESMARDRVRPDAMLDLIKEYQDHRPDLKPYDEFDMPALLQARKDNWERSNILDILEVASRICGGAIAGKKKEDPPLSGPKDAIAYVMEHVEATGIFREYGSRRCNLRQSAAYIVDEYNKIKDERNDGSLFIPSGLDSFDDLQGGGFRRGTFWGVLGYAGSNKSGVSRTIALNAAKAGFRVLVIPCEISVIEELMRMAIMYCQDQKFEAFNMNIDIKQLENGGLTDAESSFLEAVVLPNLEESLPGEVIVRTTSERKWPDIVRLIESENRIHPIDMVIIDYLAMVDVPDNHDKREAMNRVIADFKKLCLTFNGGRGIVGITPIQGNRNGMKDARENGGVWSKDGIAEYSEFEKSTDGVISVYTDAELQAENKLKIATCKNRRGPDLPVETYSRCPNSGLVTQFDRSWRKMEDPRDCL